MNPQHEACKTIRFSLHGVGVVFLKLILERSTEAFPESVMSCGKYTKTVAEGIIGIGNSEFLEVSRRISFRFEQEIINQPQF